MGAYLVLVALLFLCGFSFSQECVRDLHENVDFPGRDLTYVFSPDVNHCQLLCSQHPSCLFFTFLRADWTRDKRNFYCYLKFTPSGQPDVQTPLLGVTSGYSLKSCIPNPDVCLSQVYTGIDFPEADYRSLFTTDYEECQRACTSDPSCQFFTFVKGLYKVEKIRYKCHLKFSWTMPIIPVMESTVGVVSGFSHKLFEAKTNETICLTKMFPSTNIPGQDFRQLLAVSPNHCQSLCSAHPHCTYFSYVTTPESKMFHCYLKNNANEMVTRAQAGVISGLPARHCKPDNSWVKDSYEGVNFRGSDMRYVLLDNPDACQITCTEDPNCQFYTYVNESFHDANIWRRCFLKRVITLPAPPKVTHLPNVVSGFSLKNC